MAETLGSLCDKLTIVKLKQYHTNNSKQLNSLACQEKQLSAEIDRYVVEAMIGDITLEKLTFSSNKVYKKKGNAVEEISGSLGRVIATLAKVNCDLWHEQEKVYEFEKIPVNKKDSVIKQLAKLNLIRTKCIDKIDTKFKNLVGHGK